VPQYSFQTLRSTSQVKLKDARMVASEDVKARSQRAAALANRKAVEAQMADKLHRDYLEDIHMSATEKAYMQPLLKQAAAVVKEAHIVPVKW